MGTRMYYTIDVSAKKSEEDKHQAEEKEHKYKIEVSAVRHKDKEKTDEFLEQYIKNNGHHFTKELAEEIVDRFVSVNPKISFDKTEEMLKHSDDSLPEEITIGDLHVMVNEIRATHSTSTVKSDVHALSLAIENLNNPNKDNDLFDDWMDILMRRKEKIDWEKYV
nr:MAG TPA: hypothetical protein [Caudoviricetes sp.]